MATDIRVYMVAPNPHLTEQFQAVYNPHQKADIPQTHLKLSGASTIGAFDKHEKSELQYTDNTSLNSTYFSQSEDTPKPQIFQPPISLEAWPSLHTSTNTQNEVRTKQGASDALSAISRMAPLIFPHDTNVSAAPDPRQPFAHPGPRRQTPMPSLLSVTRLSLSFCGEDITCDLKTLEPDPKFIIELLKTTDSECGSWMTVGAHYRRSGNFEAAIAVIKSMIEGNWRRGSISIEEL